MQQDQSQSDIGPNEDKTNESLQAEKNKSRRTDPKKSRCWMCNVDGDGGEHGVEDGKDIGEFGVCAKFLYTLLKNI